MAEPAPELALAAICGELVRLGRRFALVGGLAVSVRAEVRSLKRSKSRRRPRFRRSQRSSTRARDGGDQLPAPR